MSESRGPGLDDARKMAEGVAGVFSALRALCVADPEVESLCQVGAVLAQNLSNELETAPQVRRIPVVGEIGEVQVPAEEGSGEPSSASV